MPGRSDSAIDFYSSAFCREVLDRAHPLRFAKERITYGNNIFDGFRGQIWPANTLDEIAEGRRLAGTRRVPLARLDGGSRRYGRLLDNVLRPRRSPDKALSGRGPPPEPPKTRENKMFGVIDGAAGARRRGERAVAA